MSVRLKFVYRAYRYRFRVDPGEIRFVRDSLKRGQVAADIGCHKGAYTYWMRRAVGPSGGVYAFEPQPQQIDYLRTAFSAMHYDNVELVPMALSDHCGEMLLYESPESTHFASLEPKRNQQVTTAEDSTPAPPVSLPAPRPSHLAPRSYPVPVTTLDDFFSQPGRRPPDFVKIDVEGHELAVLLGARNLLQCHHPTLLVESEARHRPDGDIRPVFNFLESLRYAGSFFSHGARWPLSEFDPAVHQRLKPIPGHLPPGYVNNFAFT